MNMETEHDALDLLDMSDWHQANDHLHLFDHNPENNNPPLLRPMSADSEQNTLYSHGLPTAHGISAGNVSLNNSNPASLFGIKKNVIPTITTIYEPKFFEIYQAYIQHQQQFDPDVNNSNPGLQHLVTLCLNNLLCFCNWARDSTTGTWIRATLFENPDMRPEVRNGLAMILVYTFSAAKAADLRNVHPSSNATIDMFTVLMKTDSGMGIVNKTSLKIYSDPFGYFNFLKTCISGLIDASAIPENERVNNQTKKTRRGSKNRDEVEAYNYVKNSIVAMLQSPDSLQLARDRIHQILQFWHVKGKAIRNERFSCVFSLPPPPVGSSLNANPNAMKMADDNSTMVSNGPTGEYGGGRGSGVSNRTSNRSSGGSLSIDTMSNPYSSANPYGHPPGGSGGGVSANVGVNDNDSVNSDSISSCSRSPYPSFHDYNTGTGRSSGATNNFRFTAGSGGSNSVGMSQNQSQYLAMIMSSSVNNSGNSANDDNGSIFYDLQNFSKNPGLALIQAQSTMNIPVPALRFDRVGGLKWQITSTFLYDFDALHHSTHRTSFYLVDEVKLKAYLIELIAQSQQSPPGFTETSSQGVFQLSLSYLQAAAGLSSMEKILFKSNSVLTSWSQLDFTQLKIFVDGWKLQSVHSQLKSGSNPLTADARPQRLPNSILPQQAAIATAPVGGIGSSAFPSSSSVASNIDDMDTASVISASTAGTSIGEGFHIGSSSAALDPTLNRRISRRRTTGGLELKRDLARLQQLHDMNNDRSKIVGANNYPAPANSPLHSPPFSTSYASTQSPQFSNLPIEPQFSPSLRDRDSDRKTASGSGGNSANNSAGNSIVVTATPQISLIEYWQSLHKSPSCGLASSSSLGNPSVYNSSGSTENGSRGMIIYERSSEVGLIVRANPKYNIAEDLWCLYYPEDAMEQFSNHLNNLANSGQQSNPLDYSFAAFLCTLLPQTRDIFRHLQASQPRHGFAFANPLNAITIGYYPHHPDNTTSNPFLSISQMGPPSPPGTSSQYRTVGNIDHPFHQILSKFSSESFFHDISLL